MEGKAALLLDQEQSLREKAKILKSDLERLNSEIVSKQSEIDYLLAKVAELKSNKGRCEFPSEENNGESYQGRKLNHEKATEPGRLAETLLHEEMWREVFSKVDDGLDLLNASWTCQNFHDILDPLRNNFLFGNVLPPLLPHLGFSDILKCRLVCRDWRSTINSFLEEMAKINMLDYPSRASDFHPLYNISDNVISAYCFWNKSRHNCRYPSQFLPIFNSYVRNPFIANAVSIVLVDEVKEPSEEVKFRKEIATILDTFGRHINHFKWLDPSFPFGPFSGLGAAELLRQLFSKAQNLQTLVVNNYFDYENAANIELEDVTDSLPNFKTLACKLDEKLPIVNWLFRNFHLQITKLQLQNFEGIITASEFTWPEVIELSFESFYWDEKQNYLKYFRSFPGLKKLCLFVDGSTLPKILDITQALPTLCPSFHALQLYLSLHEAESVYREAEATAPIAPQEVDILELNVMIDCYGSIWKDFPFLLRFPFVKRLSIVSSLQFWNYDYEFWRRMEGDKVVIVELLKYMAAKSNPRSSNVWRMLPNLETLQLQNKIYKRPKTSCTKRE